MYLQCIEIWNFRGIRHLRVELRPDATILIGENTWGKSSLLRVLWLVLGQGEFLCEFTEPDLYIPLPDLPDFTCPAQQHAKTAPQAHSKSANNASAALQICPAPSAEGIIAVNLDFKEPYLGCLAHSLRLQRLGKAWQRCPDGLHIIRWRIRALRREGKFVTEHYLANHLGAALPCPHEQLIRQLIAMNPVLRLRDSRMLYTSPDQTSASPLDLSIELPHLVLRKTQNHPSNEFPAQHLDSSCDALGDILSRYLSQYASPRLLRNRTSPRTVRDMVSRPLSVDSLESLRRSLTTPGISRAKIMLALLTGALRQSCGWRNIERKARPIVILEDIEARLHPTLLLGFLAIVEALPVQKIMTTNSGDILSAVPLQAVRRLCRYPEGTLCYGIGDDTLSVNELRRIAFHLRLNRPMTLFARCWIMVEGETEVWLLSEMARLMGMPLAGQGIRLVEFAQCGLTPLLKLARAMGIAFHVLTDGDEAGVKYAATVRDFVGRSRTPQHLTVLPHLDIEHFFYANGFEQLYLREANLHPPLRKGFGADKVIEMAVRRRTKPGLALALLEAIEHQGPDSIPQDLRTMFTKLHALAAGESGASLPD